MKILLDPLERHLLIQQASIDNALTENFVRGQEPKSSELVRFHISKYTSKGSLKISTYPILDIHADKMIPKLSIGTHSRCEVVLAVACAIPTAVNPDQDRQSRAFGGIAQGSDIVR